MNEEIPEINEAIIAYEKGCNIRDYNDKERNNYFLESIAISLINISQKLSIIIKNQ